MVERTVNEGGERKIDVRHNSKIKEKMERERERERVPAIYFGNCELIFEHIYKVVSLDKLLYLSEFPY